MSSPQLFTLKGTRPVHAIAKTAPPQAARVLLSLQGAHNSPDTADVRPADIYSLAKTVWVLLSGQTYPPPGEQRASVEGLRISSYVDLAFGAELDELLEDCTRHEPHNRPSAATFRDRLIQMLQ